MKCKRATDGRTHAHDVLEVMREQAVKALLSGESKKTVAAAFGLNRRTIFRWFSDYHKGGFASLEAKSIAGRPRKITHAELVPIFKGIAAHSPGYAPHGQIFWSFPALTKLINDQLTRDISTAAVRRHCRSMFSALQDSLPAHSRHAIEAHVAAFSDAGRSPCVSCRLTGAQISDGNSLERHLYVVTLAGCQGGLQFMFYLDHFETALFKFFDSLLNSRPGRFFVTIDSKPEVFSDFFLQYLHRNEDRLALFSLSASCVIG